MVTVDANGDELESGDRIQIQVPPLEERLLAQSGTKFAWILDFFHRTLDRREEISISVPSPVAGVRRHLQFFRRINWASLLRAGKEWLKNPLHIALLLWLLCVAASVAMLGGLLLGLLNRVFPTKSLRNHWIEINNQFLNALFTLMSLYQHPNLFHHLFMLCRWSSEDVVELRKVYCKNAAYRPREWLHMLVLLLLLHLTCFAQYALCGLYWGYSSKSRPEALEASLFALGITAPVLAALYAVCSPLGRDCGGAAAPECDKPAKQGFKLLDQRIAEKNPQWNGALLDCRDDTSICCLSFFCTCCVFGWNMERLGMGNMYVHVSTFLVLCFAPFWIFNIAALNIHNYVIGDAIGIAGVLLCVFGLLYGGFWRIQMRKRFKLPGDGICWFSASIVDYAKWIFCWACALAQEVRTGNSYDVEEGSLFRKLTETDEEDSMSAPIQPVMRL
ncbi:uncharacterized protein LOC121974338 [Zingiber officinale]|uniref:PLAC8 family protein n=1 Tax=Zingiber officinale TaxID=94328 RepID=A0A8J5GJW1_ZINOF|nr:uncharacterized protein LOC121974338 [Zingiber officinale]KAG6509402.1 hypothetical protein ZIOFF_027390 [Zingiber officinale]